MQSNSTALEPPAKKNQTPLMIAIAAIVLCCCCTVAAGVGYYGYTTMQNTANVAPNTDFGAGEAPTGGLGDDTLRNDTWQYVAAAAEGQGCDKALGSNTVIDVLQEPTNGVWVEKWTVACASGDTYAYEIEFTLDSTGTTFNIKPLQ